jgi:hypothetical protein
MGYSRSYRAPNAGGKGGEKTKSGIRFGGICQNRDMMFQSFHSTDLLAPVISACETNWSRV